MPFLPGRLLVMLAAAAAAGFALGSGQDLLTFGLGLVALFLAGLACWRLSSSLESPSPPERLRPLALLACLGGALLGLLASWLGAPGAGLLALLLLGAAAAEARLLPG